MAEQTLFIRSAIAVSFQLNSWEVLTTSGLLDTKPWSQQWCLSSPPPCGYLSFCRSSHVTYHRVHVKYHRVHVKYHRAHRSY